MSILETCWNAVDEAQQHKKKFWKRESNVWLMTSHHAEMGIHRFEFQKQYHHQSSNEYYIFDNANSQYRLYSQDNLFPLTSLSWWAQVLK